MIPVRYGTNRVSLGLYDPFPFQCPGCKQINTVEFALYGDYYHVWYIPIFPFEKDGYAKCSNCNFTINSLKYNKLTCDDFKQIRKKFRFPYFTYLGAALFLFPFIVAIFLVLFSSKS
jgi:hypothetical protein